LRLLEIVMATLQVQVRHVPAKSDDDASSPLVVVTIGGEAVVELEPLVSGLQSVAQSHPQRVVLDLSGLSFMSSLAMGVVLAFRRNVLAQGGSLKVAAVQKMVLDSFKRARLDKVFELTETLDGALAALA
jgi:anti-sigma B factor antagonist